MNVINELESITTMSPENYESLQNKSNTNMSSLVDPKDEQRYDYYVSSITATTIESRTTKFFPKSDPIKNKVTLKNSWPMSHLNDVVGNAHLFGGSNYSFVPDRFENPNSAIYFNNGYLQLEHGTYISGDFTVTLWLYLKSYSSSANVSVS